MDKTYQPEQIEQHWYQSWETSGYFRPNFEGIPYCIMLPPPNVTGTLHMGHGFQVSLMDALIRYHRMQGNNALWLVGTDHAGIATQMVVELQLMQEGTTRELLGRDKFIQRVWEWKDRSDSTIKNQLRRMGASVDWTRERFSLDEGLSEAVLEVFVSLFQEGLIYRGQRLVNWDPQLLTAISDLEVVSQEEMGSLWYVNYPLEKEEGYLCVATTRPETMFADVAVAVNPEDDRYKHLIGSHVILPLVKRKLPIIADASIAQEFGTGCVKITPAHDFNDYAMGQRHNLPMINIFTPDAKLNHEAPERYQGLERFEARAKLVEELSDKGFLKKTEPHLLNVPRGERSGEIIEPYLTKQWFIKTKPLAGEAIEAVKNGQIKFVPDSWSKVYYQWLENIEDWCISRQLWWGHRIPAWYDKDGNSYVGRSESEIRHQYQLPADVCLHQDEDVLDTWFSAALWPFATLGWPKSTVELTEFYPTNVLVTGFDIIFFWVARMIMMGLKFKKQIPFDTVYITGLIRDNEGQKMSKSKGNILDPIDLVDGINLQDLLKKRTQNLIHPNLATRIRQLTEKEFPEGIPAFGTDSLRFTFYALATTGRDIRFDLSRIEGYRNFCNKLWNAARFVLMNTENVDLSIVTPSYYSVADFWIQSQLQSVIQKAHECFQSYRFDLLAQLIYDFVWNEYCDWYVELAKPILYADDNHLRQCATRRTLLEVLESILRLTHPLMPFITEEIWQRLAPILNLNSPTIMLQAYPTLDKSRLKKEAEEEIDWLKKVVIAIRTIRAEMNIAPSKMISVIFSKGTEQDIQRVESHRLYLKTLAKVAEVQWSEHAPSAAATSIVDQLEIFIPLTNLIDKTFEIKRLNKEISKLEKDLEKSQSKINNQNYLQKAPAAIIEQEKLRTLETVLTLEKLKSRLQTIENM